MGFTLVLSRTKALKGQIKVAISRDNEILKSRNYEIISRKNEIKSSYNEIISHNYEIIMS